MVGGVDDGGEYKLSDSPGCCSADSGPCGGGGNKHLAGMVRGATPEPWPLIQEQTETQGIFTVYGDTSWIWAVLGPVSSPLSNITDLGDQAVPLLIEALTHDDPLIRRTAAETLGQLKSPFEDRVDLQPAVPHLEAMIATDPDPLVRLHAAEALWIITKNKKVVPGFIEALSDEDVEVRRFAVSMIGLVEADLQDVIQP